MVASHKLLNDMFVDDLVSGGELTEVLRFMGKKDKSTGKRNGTMTQIMERVDSISRQCRKVETLITSSWNCLVELYLG